MTDKFKIIDKQTFESIRQSSNQTNSTIHVPKIRNAKYKRMHSSNNFNILLFIKNKNQGRSSINKRRKIKKPIDLRITTKKKKGKQRENGSKKKLSRLKKSILHYRQMKREHAKLEEQLSESVHKLMHLKVDENSDNHLEVSADLHSRRFREYCDCCTTPELKQCCEQLVRELNHFQRRAFVKNDIKARAHRRFVVGFRQVKNYLCINKIKLVIIATDCERNDGDVSLDHTIESIKTTCNDQQIPVVFAFQRREMAYILYKKASISCIGILDYDGAREKFSQLMEALKNARKLYQSLLRERI